ncbi:MAG: hypothetical protein LBC97_15970 [Bifidobacteriaceae bacterium]|nr:hypothetical protein [Bifidobacteriaceae bacterium]
MPVSSAAVGRCRASHTRTPTASAIRGMATSLILTANSAPGPQVSEVESTSFQAHSCSPLKAWPSTTGVARTASICSPRSVSVSTKLVKKRHWPPAACCSPTTATQVRPAGATTRRSCSRQGLTTATRGINTAPADTLIHAPQVSNTLAKAGRADATTSAISTNGIMTASSRAIPQGPRSIRNTNHPTSGPAARATPKWRTTTTAVPRLISATIAHQTAR